MKKKKKKKVFLDFLNIQKIIVKIIKAEHESRFTALELPYKKLGKLPH